MFDLLLFKVYSFNRRVEKISEFAERFFNNNKNIFFQFEKLPKNFFMASSSSESVLFFRVYRKNFFQASGPKATDAQHDVKMLSFFPFAKNENLSYMKKL